LSTLKVFANEDAAEKWFAEYDRKASRILLKEAGPALRAWQSQELSFMDEQHPAMHLG